MSQQERRNGSASTITQFCKDHHISRSMYYKLQKQGQGPKQMMVGRRRLISNEAAADWRHQMERH